jgi:energy-coupling factor transporter ATP-binding protein EcfA2
MELRTGGWKITSDHARAERRSRTVAGLPYPDEPSSLPVNFIAFRSLLNLRDQDNWDRCLCWLLAALRPEGPYPILVVTGPKASGKSTIALLLRSLIDPAQFPLTPLASNDRYIAMLAQFHWVLAFDNVKTLAPHLSAAILAANRPVILVVPEDAHWTPGPDLSDRVLTVQTRTLSDAKQQKPAAIWWDFKNLRCRALSALLTSVCVALGNRKQSGFADLADWLMAAEAAIQLSPAEIRAVLNPNKAQPVPDTLTGTIIELMTGASSWTGTATKLLKALHAIDPASTDWPKTPQAISDRLNQAVRILRPQGIEMKFTGKGQIHLARK